MRHQPDIRYVTSLDGMRVFALCGTTPRTNIDPQGIRHWADSTQEDWKEALDRCGDLLKYMDQTDGTYCGRTIPIVHGDPGTDAVTCLLCAAAGPP